MAVYTVIYCIGLGQIVYKIRCLVNVILRINLVTATVSLQLCIPLYDVYNFAITEVSGNRCNSVKSSTAQSKCFDPIHNTSGLGRIARLQEQSQ